MLNRSTWFSILQTRPPPVLHPRRKSEYNDLYSHNCKRLYSIDHKTIKEREERNRHSATDKSKPSPSQVQQQQVNHSISLHKLRVSVVALIHEALIHARKWPQEKGREDR